MSVSDHLRAAIDILDIRLGELSSDMESIPAHYRTRWPQDSGPDADRARSIQATIRRTQVIRERLRNVLADLSD